MKPVLFFAILMSLLISCESTVARVEEFSLCVNNVTTLDSCSVVQLLYADDERLLAKTINFTSDLVSIPVRESKLEVEESEYFLKYGRAVSEVMRNYSCSSVYNDTVYVMASNPYGIDKILRIPFEGINDISSWEIESTPYYNELSCLYKFDFCGSDRYVFAGGDIESEEFICFLNRKEHSFEHYNYIPDDGFDSNPFVKKTVYTANAIVCANGDDILYVCGEGRLALIIDTKDGGIRYLYDEFPKYSVASDGLNYLPDPKSSLGTRAFATDKAIYLSPYLGNIVNGEIVPEKFKGYPWSYNDRIEVFSWKGEILYTLCLDYPFFNYILDESGKHLYTLSIDLVTGDDIIYQYDLPTDID